MELREIYNKTGMREEERQVTFALNHNRRVKLWEKPGFFDKLDSLFNLVCFELTCDYGMTPRRPLYIMLGVLFSFTLPYLWALGSRNPRAGIWLVLLPDRILGRKLRDRPARLNYRLPFRPLPEEKWARFTARPGRGLRALRLAFYFSLLSAFHLGWREFNVGTWINRIQKREYCLRATGWPRTLSGIQSVLSVYMLTLWALSYFGRPFE